MEPVDSPRGYALSSETAGDGECDLDFFHDDPEVDEFFWSPPYYTSVLLDNETSEARDALASERNFLTALRSSFAIALAAGFCGRRWEHRWYDWALIGVLYVIALALPVAALFNYAHSLDSWQLSRGAVRNTRTLTISIILAILVAILANIRAFFVQGRSTL